MSVHSVGSVGFVGEAFEALSGKINREVDFRPNAMD